MISLSYLFELEQKSDDRWAMYIKNRRQEVDQYRQAGNKPEAVRAANRLQQALRVGMGSMNKR